MGRQCDFCVKVKGVCHETFHNVDSDFLVPSSPQSFLQPRVIEKHLVWATNTRYILVLDMQNISFCLNFPFLLMYSTNCMCGGMFVVCQLHGHFPLDETHLDVVRGLTNQCINKKGS